MLRQFPNKLRIDNEGTCVIDMLPCITMVGMKADGQSRYGGITTSGMWNNITDSLVRM